MAANGHRTARADASPETIEAHMARRRQEQADAGPRAMAAPSWAWGRSGRWRAPWRRGAATGGVAGAAFLPLGPARAGAINASVMSVAQDVFNGRPISTERAGESAILGNLLGGLAGVWGRAASNRLSSKAKGRLGEALGDMRSTINGERRVWAPKTRDPLSTTNKKDYWYPDGRSGQKRLEDKFGVGAELSPRQIRA